jgi:uncharacterized RDD family membrane protein YckC
MTQRAGWYDDPQDPGQLRYWDGVVWSSHVSPKVSPSVEQSTSGSPYGVIPAGERPQSPGSQGAQRTPTVQDGYGTPRQEVGQPASPWPAYGQGPGQPGQYGQQILQPQQATTPDGVVLSGWWKRVLARILDQFFTFFIGLPLTGWFYYQYTVGYLRWIDDLTAQTTAGSAPVFELPPGAVFGSLFAAAAIQIVVSAAYEVIFLRRSGATPGKKIVGISVRLRDQAGQMPMSTVLVRTGVFFGMQLINVAYLLDVLWPLWDDKKQAIHDKAAATNVVVGPQPRREA